MAKINFNAPSIDERRANAAAAAQVVAQAAVNTDIPEDDPLLYGTEAEPENKEDDQDDDSWLDQLTPFQSDDGGTNPYARVAAPAAPQAPEAPKEGFTPQQQQENLDKLYEGLEHLDEDSARELKTKILDPVLTKQEERLARLEKERQQEAAQQAKTRLDAATKKILAKHPKAASILQSTQFVEFINSGVSKYATEKPSDLLAAAYYQHGDADYVIGELDKFVESRKKPKPPVGAEPQQGRGTSGVAPAKAGRKMSYAEYEAKAQAIMAAPRGTYPPHALRDLELQYHSQ
uniref:Scaffolding protein n=1 Tax=Podoviridae sp. ctnCN2 TaxID=2825274 RepID=A0A8S5PN30_9CAUD|nr:MAG TPA: hypothetical protein [Podoviridae sp. ctnCN2]